MKFAETLVLTRDTAMPDALYASSLHGLPLLKRGKVRDIYEIDDDHLLIVTTDRLSAFDEALTPDSPRFWPADAWVPGRNPPSFDKQYARDWLEGAGWNKQPPAPELPPEIAAKTAEKYREALVRLAGENVPTSLA